VLCERDRRFEIARLLYYSIDYIAFAHGAGIFFVGTDDGIFSFDLKSGQAKKVFNDPCVGYGVNIVVPYVSFCTPGTTLLGL